MKLPVYNSEGKEVKKIELSDDIFGLDWNADLVHQVVTSLLGNARDNIAHTKNRGDVSGGGIKPWRQKGTGRARHGSIRSPLWRGGGITFGPRNDRNFNRKVNKKMKAKALATVLSQKIRDNEVLLVDSVKFEEPKTTAAKAVIDALSKTAGFEQLATKKNNAAVIGLSELDKNTVKSFSNFNNMNVEEVRNFNPAVLLNYKYVVIMDAENSLKILSDRLNKTNK
jgi:large subunit ribosomal protein L4